MPTDLLIPPPYNVAPGATPGDTCKLTMTADDITYTGGDEIFADGFEAGDTAAWSSTT